MQNPFEFFDLPISLILDKKELRGRFIEIQQTAHPDFGQQDDISEKANEAFLILKDDEKRTLSILALNSSINANDNKLSTDFLMEMMDLSDLIEEVRNLESEKQLPVRNALERQREDLLNRLIDLDRNWKEFPYVLKEFDNPLWNRLLVWYQESRYLHRLEKNLSGIEEI
jgi:hypothetical protein